MKVSVLLLSFLIIPALFSSCEEPEMSSSKTCMQPPSGELKTDLINLSFATFTDYEKIEILHSEEFVEIPKDGIHDNIYNWIYLEGDGPVDTIRMTTGGNLKEYPVELFEDVKWEPGGAYIIYDHEDSATYSTGEDENKIYKIHEYEKCVDLILFVGD
ncbi:MAG: hypothetical protein ACNS60_10560 [Candidatus Cyclobacteriaceae bacterium M2_1C_046]